MIGGADVTGRADLAGRRRAIRLAGPIAVVAGSVAAGPGEEG